MLVCISHVYGYSSRTVTKKVEFFLQNGALVIGPKKIKNGFNQVSANTSDGSLKFKSCLGNPKSVTKFIFLSRLNINASTTNIFVETEPWSLLLLQVLLYRFLFARKASISIFTWENFRRKGLAGKVINLLYKLAIRNCCSIICGNEDGKIIFKQLGAVESQLYVITQFGIESELFKPVQTEIEKNSIKSRFLASKASKFIIGFAGRLVEEKGILDLYQAVLKLINNGAVVHLFILGNGPLAKEINNSDIVTVKDAISQDEMPVFLNSLDLLVLPSKTSPFWVEQFGRILIEAMACRVPVIGSSSGEIPRVIGNSECVFEEGNINQLAELIGKFINDKNFYGKIKQEHFQRSKTFFNDVVYKSQLHAINKQC